MSIRLSLTPRQSSPTDADLMGLQSRSFEVRILSSASEKIGALKLRSKAYAALGYANVASTNGIYADQYDEVHSTVLMGAFDGDRLVGSVRLCFAAPGEALGSLPCAPYYPALKELERQHGDGLMEVSRLSVDPDIDNTSYRTTLYATLVRTALVAAQAAGVSHILIATRPDWVRFYKYMLGFTTVGEPEFYPPGDFKITLLAGTLAQAEMRQRLQNKFFRISDTEVASMRTAIAPALEPAPIPEIERKIA